MTDLKLPAHATFGFELDPPAVYNAKTAAKMAGTIVQLAALGPSRFSVPFGANGTVDESTPLQSLRTAAAISKVLGVRVAAHMICIGERKKANIALAEKLAEADVPEILALTGERPQEGEKPRCPPEESFAGTPALVQALGNVGNFRFLAAADFSFYDMEHSDSTLQGVVSNLTPKLAAGVRELITQFTFMENNVAMGMIALEKTGILQTSQQKIPLIAGVPCILNFPRMFDIADKSKVPVPSALRQKHGKTADHEGTIDKGMVGQELLTGQLVHFVSQGIIDFHFYRALPGMLTRIIGPQRKPTPMPPNAEGDLQKELLRHFVIA